MTPRAQRRTTLLCAALLTAAPILAFYGTLLRYVTTVPVADDYTALLHFALRARALPTLAARLQLLLQAQDGDYKLWLDHLLVLADLAFTGRVHLGLYITVGNLLLLPILWLLWRHFPAAATPTRLLAFAPVPLLLFQLNYAETVDWAMAGLQNLGVLAFSLLAIHFLLARRTIAATAFAALAIAASANGFLLLPIGLWVLGRRRAYTALLLWCATFAALFAAYRSGLHLAPKQAVSPLALLRFLLRFTGGGLENMHHQPVPGASLLFGTLLLLLLAVLVFRHNQGPAAPPAQANPAFVLWSVFWILLTALVVSAGRAGFGPEIALAGRYKIYCDLLLALAYMLAVTRTRRPLPTGAYFVIVAASAAMCLASGIAGSRFLRARHDELLQGAARFTTSNGTLSPTHTGDEPVTAPSGMDTATRILLLQSQQAGIYTLPAPRRP